MAYIPTTFVDRSVEFPNRRKLTAVSGLADTFDVARAEGTVFAAGTKLDAANLNAEFGKIKTETDDINSSLKDITTEGIGYYDSNYLTSATSIVFLKNGAKEIKFNAQLILNNVPDNTNIFSTSVLCTPFKDTFIVGKSLSGHICVILLQTNSYARAWGPITADTYYFDTSYFSK